MLAVLAVLAGAVMAGLATGGAVSHAPPLRHGCDCGLARGDRDDKIRDETRGNEREGLRMREQDLERASSERRRGEGGEIERERER